MTHCDHVPVERSYCTRALTHCDHKANKPSHCTRWPLRQTNAVVPDIVTFAVEPQNGASFDPRPRSIIYDYCYGGNLIFWESVDLGKSFVTYELGLCDLYNNFDL